MNFLKGLLEGGVRYESESRHFALSYDQRRTTILRILRQLEVASQQAGKVYWPTDVQPSEGPSSPSNSMKGRPVLGRQIGYFPPESHRDVLVSKPQGVCEE